MVLLHDAHSSRDAVAAEAAGGARRGQQFWHHGTSASGGVAVLICDSARVSDARIGFDDAHGRILRVDFTYAGLPMAVVNVYARSVATERGAFFSEAIPAALLGGGSALVAGDSNGVLSEVDRSSSPDRVLSRQV
jgi:hypothetical protein